MNYFVIKLFNQRMRQRGYVVITDKSDVKITRPGNPDEEVHGAFVGRKTHIKTLNGVVVVNADQASLVTKFESELAAWQCIKEKKLATHGIQCLVIPATDMAKDPLYPTTELSAATTYYIENTKGQKLCYETKQGFYFLHTDQYFSGWQTEEQAKKVLDDLGLANAAVKPLNSPKTEAYV